MLMAQPSPVHPSRGYRGKPVLWSQCQLPTCCGSACQSLAPGPQQAGMDLVQRLAHCPALLPSARQPCQGVSHPSPGQGHCPPNVTGASCHIALPGQLCGQQTALSPRQHGPSMGHTERRISEQGCEAATPAHSWGQSFWEKPAPAGQGYTHPQHSRCHLAASQGCKGSSRQKVTQTPAGSVPGTTHPHRNEKLSLGRAALGMLGSG